MRARLLSTFLCLLVALGAGARATVTSYVFPLRGDQETPDPVPTTASGGCLAVLDDTVHQATFTCVHDVVGATVMHVHRGAAGTSGAIVFDLGDPTVQPVTATWTGMTTTDESDLQTGNFYVNVHTAGRPTGEIRGQIVDSVDTVTFTMDGSQFVPPNGSPSTGACTANLDDADPPAFFAVSACTHNVPSPVEAHVHQAPSGQNGPVILTFPSAASPLTGSIPLTAAQVAAYAAPFLYLEVHGVEGSESDPPTTIRGQIGSPPAAPTTATLRIVKRTFPAGGGGFDFTADAGLGGPSPFPLDDGDEQPFANVPPGSYTVTESDPSLGNHALARVSCDDADSSGDPFAHTATAVLEAGDLVTCTFTNLRTLPTDSLFVFDLSGAHEIPSNNSTARGGCAARFDAGSSSLSIVCVHDVVGATVMHIHRGAAGTTGPVVFDLGSPVSPVTAAWTGLTPADVADLLAGNLYVNIHDSGRPDGEIRGQILPRTVDSVAFDLLDPTTALVGGSCTADLTNDAGSLGFLCDHTIASTTAAHLHEGADGATGPVAFNFPSATSPIAASVDTHPLLLADFAAGFLYVDVHAVPPGGEGESVVLRGQVGAAAPGPQAAAVPALGTAGAALLALALAALGTLQVVRRG